MALLNKIDRALTLSKCELRIRTNFVLKEAFPNNTEVDVYILLYYSQ